MADALDRARAHVQVRVLLDAQGSKEAGKELVQRMRNAGCRVTFFHKRAIHNIGVLNEVDLVGALHVSFEDRVEASGQRLVEQLRRSKLRDQ